MIRNADADFGNEWSNESNQKIQDTYDKYIINSEYKVSGTTNGMMNGKCINYCGMQNRDTNYVEIEKEHGNKRKCWCYVIPGKLFYCLYVFL